MPSVKWQTPRNTHSGKVEKHLWSISPWRPGYESRSNSQVPPHKSSQLLFTSAILVLGKKMSKSLQICKQMCWWKWLREHFTIPVQLESELTKVMPSHSFFAEPPWVGSQEHSVLSYWAAAAFLRSFPEIPQEPLNLVLFPHTKLKQQLPSAELLKKVQESWPELVRITPSHIPSTVLKEYYLFQYKFSLVLFKI